MDIRNGLTGFALACSLVLVGGPATADDDKEALARQLFGLVNADQVQQSVSEPLIEVGSEQILRQVKARLSSEDIELDETQSGELGALVNQRYRLLMEETVAFGREWTVDRYVETFSKEELAELAEIYARPAMQHIVSLTPRWIAELTKLSQQYGGENIDRVVYGPLKEWLSANVGTK